MMRESVCVRLHVCVVWERACDDVWKIECACDTHNKIEKWVWLRDKDIMSYAFHVNGASHNHSLGRQILPICYKNALLLSF